MLEKDGKNGVIWRFMFLFLSFWGMLISLRFPDYRGWGYSPNVALVREIDQKKAHISYLESLEEELDRAIESLLEDCPSLVCLFSLFFRPSFQGHEVLCPVSMYAFQS